MHERFPSSSQIFLIPYRTLLCLPLENADINISQIVIERRIVNNEIELLRTKGENNKAQPEFTCNQ